jgi:hypothetical protein
MTVEDNPGSHLSFARVEPSGYRSIEMKSTSSLNFSGYWWAKLVNDGIGGFGWRSGAAIATVLRREPSCVSGGPGPLLPL